MIAELVAIGLHLGSWHPDPNWNNVNPGIYATVAVNGHKITAGTVRNSYAIQSYYIGYTFEYSYFALTVGGITGYAAERLYATVGGIDDYRELLSYRNQYKLSPMIAPSVRLPLTDNLNVRVMYFPKVSSKGSNALHATIEYQF